MREQFWLMRLTTALAAFCAFILGDIYRDFKKVREDVTDHKYQIEALNNKYDEVRDDIYKMSYDYPNFAQKDKTMFSIKR